MIALRVLLALVLATSSIHSIASSKSAEQDRKILAVVVNVDCPYCKELFEYNDKLSATAQNNDIELVWVPIPNGIDAVTAWPERFYYATRILPAPYPNQVLKTLMLAQDVKKLVTPEAVTAWLELNLPSVDWQLLVEDKVYAADTVSSVEKGIRLAQASQIKSFPHYVLISTAGPEKLSIGGDVKEQVKKLINYMENKL